MENFKPLLEILDLAGEPDTLTLIIDKRMETYHNLPDAQNPAYLFSMTHVELLTAIAKGFIDPVALAKEELANRGLNQDGQWVGFQKLTA